MNENADHLLVKCHFAKSVWWMVCRWLNVPLWGVFSSVVSILNHGLNLDTDSKKKIVYAILMLTIWSIWISRNEAVFNRKFVSPLSALKEIKSNSW
ncbi:hypothetical protein HanIR_Chr01g0037321 [Helianthus annuus]|nr:hypothetical protein HanIR_Chr01g0037321 [Helianthus annuus]